MKLLLTLLFISGCATHIFSGEPRQGKTVYSYSDAGGRLNFSRESKVIKKTLVTRNQFLSPQNKLLEKSVMVSQIGSIKSKSSRILTVRPEASEFQIWLEGKKYSSQMKINEQAKSMSVTLSSPETKWNGSSEHKFPKGKYFCFFNQLPECLYRNYLLEKAYKYPNQKFDFFVIWDGYPYIQDLYSGVGTNLFSSANLVYEGPEKKSFRYIIEIDGQTIVYVFSKSFDLEKIAWIAQGIIVVPPGQEVQDE